MSSTNSGARGDDADLTSVHVRAALDGDSTSLEGIISHFSPFLLAQARYRLGRHLRGRYDPEDLVQQTWCVALPKLDRIVPRDGRCTPVLLRFLGTVLLRHYRRLLEKHRQNEPLALELDVPELD